MLNTWAYRGQHGPLIDQPIQTRLPSISFGDKEVAMIYAKEPNVRADTPVAPRVIKALLDIKKPLPTTGCDPFMDAWIVFDVMGEERGAELLIRHSDYIYNTGVWSEEFADHFEDVKSLAVASPKRLSELYLEAYALLDDADFVAQAMKKGFDGAAYGGSGASSCTTEYRVFSTSQISHVESVELE